MENTKLVTYKCPVCGGIVKFDADGVTGVCQSCGNVVEKAKTVTLNYAANSNLDRYNVDYVYDKDKLNVELSAVDLSVNKGAITYTGMEFEAVETKDLSPQKAIELEGLIKKLHYGYDDITDRRMLDTVREIRAIDENNVYGEFLYKWFNDGDWVSVLERQDALAIHSFVLPYLKETMHVGETGTEMEKTAKRILRAFFKDPFAILDKFETSDAVKFLEHTLPYVAYAPKSKSVIATDKRSLYNNTYVSKHPELTELERLVEKNNSSLSYELHRVFGKYSWNEHPIIDGILYRCYHCQRTYVLDYFESSAALKILKLVFNEMYSADNKSDATIEFNINKIKKDEIHWTVILQLSNKYAYDVLEGYKSAIAIDSFRVLFDYIRSVDIPDQEKAQRYDEVLALATESQQTDKFSNVLPMLSAIDALDVAEARKRDLTISTIYKLFQTTDEKELATAMYFFVVNKKSNCAEYIEKMINPDVITSLHFTQARSLVGYIDSLSELSDKEKTSIDNKLISFALKSFLLPNNYSGADDENLCSMFALIKSAKTDKKQLKAWYKDAFEGLQRRCKIVHDYSGAMIYLVQNGFDDDVISRFAELNISLDPEPVLTAAHFIAQSDYAQREELVEKLFVNSEWKTSFKGAIDIFGAIASMKLSSSLRDRIYNLLLGGNRIYQNGTSVYGLLSLYSFISDNAIRFERMCSLLVTFKDELFLKLTQMQLLFECGDLNKDEFLLCLDVMRKTIAFSVAEGKEKMAIAELDDVKKKCNLSDYSADVRASSANRKYIAWLNGKPISKDKARNDKMLDSLSRVEINSSAKNAKGFSNEKQKQAKDRPITIIMACAGGALALLDIIFIALLFADTKFDWYFGIAQGGRIVLDILYVALHVAAAILIGVFCDVQAEKVELFKKLCIIAISILAALMVSMFATSYVVTKEESYDSPFTISSAEEMKRMKNMPYCDFQLTDDITYYQRHVSRDPFKFYGQLDGNNHTLTGTGQLERPIFADAKNWQVTNLKTAGTLYIAKRTVYYTEYGYRREKTVKVTEADENGLVYQL